MKLLLLKKDYGKLQLSYGKFQLNQVNRNNVKLNVMVIGPFRKA